MQEFAHKVHKTLRYHANTLARGVRTVRWQLQKPVAHRPIFVIGCSRAGTTLVYKTLSESLDIGSLNRETHDFWTDLHPLARNGWRTHGLLPEDATATVREFVTQYFYAYTGRHRWVDKNNQNGLCVAYLSTLFPDAHFVYIKRSPGDNINSLIEGWARPQEFATWSHALPVTVNIEGKYRQWCFFLAEGWRDYLERPLADVCAFQYRALNEAVLAAKPSIDSKRWCEIFYEDILRDPVAAFRMVFTHCGLQFDARLETHCRGVLEKPYNAFSAIRLDKWRDGPHAAAVERALAQVQEVSARMGYHVLQ